MKRKRINQTILARENVVKEIKKKKIPLKN